MIFHVDGKICCIRQSIFTGEETEIEYLCRGDTCLHLVFRMTKTNFARFIPEKGRKNCPSSIRKGDFVLYFENVPVCSGTAIGFTETKKCYPTGVISVSN